MTRETVLTRAAIGSSGLWTRIALVLGGSLLIAIAAQVTVPMFPVPMTLQTLAVLLVGATYGMRLAGVTLLAYLAEGAMGLPVFAKGGAGLAVLMGPTGGYLFGFLIAAVIVGYAADRGWSRRFIPLVAAMLLASIAIYLPGLAQLKAVTGAAWSQVWAWGAGPFLLGDLVKLVIAALAVVGGWKALRGQA